MCDPNFLAWGLGRCKPPSGVRGRAPEANAFLQQSIENCLKIRSLASKKVGGGTFPIGLYREYAIAIQKESGDSNGGNV